MAQLVKNLPAAWETWVRCLGWEDPLEKGKAIHPGFWPGEFHGLYSSVHGVAKSWTRLRDFPSTHSLTQSKLVQTRNGESEARNLVTLLGKIVFFVPLGSLGFPGGSDGKESACNAGDLGSIPRLGRSPGEGKGSHSIILAWRIPWTV